MTKLPALGLAVALAGCTAAGTPYKDHPAHNEPVPANTARIVVFRLDRAQNSTVAAKVKIDEAEFGDLRESGFLARDVSPGSHTLVVNLPVDPGTCDLPLEIADGETGYFLVAPRSENMIARMPGSIIETLFDAFTPSALLPVAGVAWAEIGAALESAGKKCGGPFSLVRVVPTAAQAMIQDLRESTK